MKGRDLRGFVFLVAVTTAACSDRGTSELLGNETTRYAPGDPEWPADWHVADGGVDEGSGAGVDADAAGTEFTIRGVWTSTRPDDGIGDSTDLTNRDRIRFVYISLADVPGLTDGDVELTARVSAVEDSGLGHNRGQFGVVIRDRIDDLSTAGSNPDVDDLGRMGAAVFQLSGSVGGGATACSGTVETGDTCSFPTAPCYQPGTACDCRTSNQWKCDLAHQHYATYRSFGTDHAEDLEEPPLNTGISGGGAPEIDVEDWEDVWIRLQRIGADFSVSWASAAFGAVWRPLGILSGGAFASETAYIGLFVAAQNSASSGPGVSVTFSDVYVGAPRLWTRLDDPESDEVLRSTFIGSTSNLTSAGPISHDATTFFVDTDPYNSSKARVYKHATWVELGHYATLFDGDTGGVVAKDGHQHLSGFTLQAAVTGGAPLPSESTRNLYFTAKNGSTESYCIERRRPTDFTIAGESACGACTNPQGGMSPPPCCMPDWNLTTVGGVVAITRSAGEQRLYVTQPDRDGNPGTVDPKVVEMHVDNIAGTGCSAAQWEVMDTFDTDPRPSAITGAHNRLFIVHSSTDYPYVPKYDAETNDGHVSCVKYTDGSSCGTIPHCEDPGDPKCVENPTAIAIVPGAATNGSQDILYVADNALGRQQVRKFTRVDKLGEPEFAEASTGGFPLGAAGGIFSGTSGQFANDKFYNLVGLGVDPWGYLYVASNGLPGVDIRKFSSSGVFQWKALGLIGRSAGSEVVAFDPMTDGADAYGFNKHFGFDTQATEAGSEWTFKGISYDPALGEVDKDDFLARDPGNVLIREIDNEKVMFAFTGAAAQSVGTSYSSAIGDLNFHGAPTSVRIYRFNGEIARLAGWVEYLPVDVDPMPSTVSSDCDSAADLNRSPRAQLRLWQDEDADGQVDAPSEVPWTSPSIDCYVDPACEDWEAAIAALECSGPEDDDEVDCGSYLGMGCSTDPPPDFQGFNGFEISGSDDAATMWLAVGADVWKLSVDISSGHLSLGTPVRYPLAAFPGTPPSRAQGVEYQNGILYVFSNGSVFAYTDIDTTPAELFVVDALAAPAVSGSAPFSPGAGAPNAPIVTCGGNKAFDVEGDMIFISSRCTGVAVYRADTGAFVTWLSAGPGLSGLQSQQDGEMGIRAHRTSSGEYLIATGESFFRAGTPVYRWTPRTSDLPE